MLRPGAVEDEHTPGVGVGLQRRRVDRARRCAQIDQRHRLGGVELADEIDIGADIFKPRQHGLRDRAQDREAVVGLPVDRLLEIRQQASKHFRCHRFAGWPGSA